MVGTVLPTPDEACRLGPVDQLDRTVMSDEKTLGDLADRRPEVIAVPLDGEQELMLGRGEAQLLGLSLAVFQELPDRGPELQQPLVIAVI